MKALRFWERIDPRIRFEVARQKRDVVRGMLCSAGAALLVALAAVLIENVIDSVDDGSWRNLLWLAGGVVLLYGVRYFLTRGQMFYLARAGARLTSDLRIRVFAKLQRLPIGFFNEKKAGGLQSVLTNDVNLFQIALTTIKDAIDGPIKIVGALSYLLFNSWQLTLVAMAVVPFLAAFVTRSSRKMRREQGQVQTDLSRVTEMMAEHLQGMRVIKATGAEGQVTGRFSGLVENSFDSQVVTAKRVAKLKPTIEFFGAVALALVLLACAYLVREGQLSVGDLAGFLYSLDVVNQGMRSLGSMSNNLAQISAAADRIYDEVLDVPEPEATQGTRRPDSWEGRIEFRDVGFVYPDGTRALKGVSFVIEPGTSLALVGPSGAGKSTVADLLLGFYEPTEGSVLVDGVDLRDIDMAWYRKQLGVVPQQTFLFAGPIEDNLRLGAEGADDATLERAVEMANASRFVASSSDGLKTELGERGVRLSGGEGQRLAIARALVREPKVLVLDEATSNLDADSERVVTEALQTAMTSRTTLFIAHRLTTAARADKILVVRGGEALEFGTHDELMARGELYAGLYRTFVSGLAV